jgi:ribosomal protein L31
VYKCQRSKLHPQATLLSIWCQSYERKFKVNTTRSQTLLHSPILHLKPTVHVYSTRSLCTNFKGVSCILLGPPLQISKKLHPQATLLSIRCRSYERKFKVNTTRSQTLFHPPFLPRFQSMCTAQGLCVQISKE